MYKSHDSLLVEAEESHCSPLTFRSVVIRSKRHFFRNGEEPKTP